MMEGGGGGKRPVSPVDLSKEMTAITAVEESTWNFLCDQKETYVNHLETTKLDLNCEIVDSKHIEASEEKTLTVRYKVFLVSSKISRWLAIYYVF